MLNVTVTNYAELPEVLGAIRSSKLLKLRVARIKELVARGMTFKQAVAIARQEQGLK